MSNWNKPSQVKKPAPKKPTALRGLIAGAVVVLVALGAVYFFMFGNEPKVEVKKPTKTHRIKEVTPAPARTNKVEVVELTPEEKEKRRRAAGGMYTNKYGYVYNRPSTAVVTTNRSDDTVWKSFAEKVFDNSVDRAIGDLIDTEPGTVFLGDPAKLYGPSFNRKFLKSIETPIIISKDDSPEAAWLKQAVRDTKIELKARLDAGEDLAEIMRQSYTELQELGVYREELKREVEKYAKKRDLEEEDMNDLVAAANKMLGERGIKPLTMPSIAARRFARMKQLKQLNEATKEEK